MAMTHCAGASPREKKRRAWDGGKRKAPAACAFAACALAACVLIACVFEAAPVAAFGYASSLAIAQQPAMATVESLPSAFAPKPATAPVGILPSAFAPKPSTAPVGILPSAFAPEMAAALGPETAAAEPGAMDASVVLRMKLGEPGFTSETAPSGGEAQPGGVSDAFSCPPPLLLGGVLHLPLRAAAEAFGAQVVYFDLSEAVDGGGAEVPRARIECAFMGSEFVIAVGDGTASDGGPASTLNGEPLPPGSAAQLVSDVSYLPASVFDQCMGTSVSYDAQTGRISITLADDGSIRDLSGLLGEIRESRIGNSYFGWSIDVPRKSMLAETSFNGSEAMVFCLSKYITIQVSVLPADGMTLENLREEAAYRDFQYIGGQGGGSGAAGAEAGGGRRGGGTSGTGGTGGISGAGGAGGRFLESVSEDFMTASLSRIYAGSGYFYILVLTVYPMESEERFTADESSFDEGGEFRRLADTFALGSLGEPASVLDISKVRGGRMEYVRYVEIPESERRIQCWAISAMPSWFELATADNGFATVLGRGSSEQLQVSVRAPRDEGDADGAISGLERESDEMFNPAVYVKKSARLFTIDGHLAAELVYALREGRARYTCVSRRILAGGLVFELTLKTSERSFAVQEGDYLSVLDSFRAGADGSEAMRRNLARQGAAARKRRLSQQNGPTAVEGEGWRSELPGYWELGDSGFRSTRAMWHGFGFDSYYLCQATSAFVAVSGFPADFAAEIREGGASLSDTAAEAFGIIFSIEADRGRPGSQDGAGAVIADMGPSAFDATYPGLGVKRVLSATGVGESAADGVRYAVAMHVVYLELDGGEIADGSCFVVFTALPEAYASVKNTAEIDAFLEAFGFTDSGASIADDGSGAPYADAAAWPEAVG